MWMPSIDQVVDHAVIVALIVVLGWAAIGDARTLIIPNRLSLAVLALYPAWVLAAGPAVQPLHGLATGAVVLAIGFVMFARGLLGGGDAKLLAALAVWAGPGLVLQLMVAVTVVGGVLALATLADLLLRRTPAGRYRGFQGVVAMVSGHPVPYGVAIALGGLHLATVLLVM
jgi:prepilin peptidase CpaA